MPTRILITGGAGFIGSHLSDELLQGGYAVRVLDNLSPQVHGEGAVRPDYLDAHVELLVGDVRDAASVDRALDGVDAVVHLAAVVGVGQSMYRLREYMDVNSVGTSVLLEALAKRPVRKLVVASSMSIYGEGSYERAVGGARVDDAERSLDRLRDGLWDPVAEDGTPLLPIPTSEAKVARLSSVYALSKYDQERLCLLFGQAYRLPAVALRLFNTYGPRQALSNPYTGVLAIFAARVLNGRSPLVYEDGRQRRDFVNVKDVARAFRLALERDEANGEAINIASGHSVSIGELAQRLSEVLGQRHPGAVLAGKYRVGDVRHCFADIGKARRLLGFEPSVSLEAGMRELAAWLEGEDALDRSDQAQNELVARGLAV